MTALRALFLNHRRLAMVLVALTLAIKAMIPEGFMPDVRGTTISIQICADATGQSMTRQVTLPARDSGDDGGKSAKGAKGDGLCAFTALGHGALPSVDPVLLVAALLFLVALGFAPLVPASRRRITFLRPHLRGPPVLA